MSALLDDPGRLIEELRAKAYQSARYKNAGRTHPKAHEHVCWRAADKIEELCRAPNGEVQARLVREIFTRLLNLTYDQRAYSWHEIQHALGEVEDYARTRP